MKVEKAMGINLLLLLLNVVMAFIYYKKENYLFAMLSAFAAGVIFFTIIAMAVRVG